MRWWTRSLSREVRTESRRGLRPRAPRRGRSDRLGRISPRIRPLSITRGRHNESVEIAINNWVTWIGFALILLGVLIAAAGAEAGGGVSLVGIVMAGVGASQIVFPVAAATLAVGKEYVGNDEDTYRGFLFRVPVYALCAVLSGSYAVLVFAAAAVDGFTVPNRHSGLVTAGFGIVTSVIILAATWNTSTEFIGAWALIAFIVIVFRRGGQVLVEGDADHRLGKWLAGTSVWWLIALALLFLQIALPLVSLFVDIA